jgi:NAD(P)-dependent dehydrogenase (short-subunit alcohol dehydrogenase family)
MAQRAAIVTGASSGIGLAVARMLAQEGWDVTVAARRPEKLAEAVAGLREEGLDVHDVAANVSLEEDVQRVVASHRERFGRLDLLMNNAGVGIGEAVGQLTTKKVDMQLDTNIRSVMLFYREALDLLQAAGREHGNALVVNTSSISGKQGQPWLSVYSATKAAVVAFTQAMHKELMDQGIKSCALCPAFVDTNMTDFVKGAVKAEDMIHTSDIVAAVRFLLETTPACIVPEIQFLRRGDGL